MTDGILLQVFQDCRCNPFAPETGMDVKVAYAALGGILPGLENPFAPESHSA